MLLQKPGQLNWQRKINGYKCISIELRDQMIVSKFNYYRLVHNVSPIEKTIDERYKYIIRAQQLPVPIILITSFLNSA